MYYSMCQIHFSCLLGVAKGLLHIHSKHILHNDLKADNIALTDCLPACNGTLAHLWPIIIDFNKACPSSKGKKYTLDPHQRKAFKKHYTQLAPDLIDGMVEQTFLSDVYSFGKLMERMANACSDKGGSGKYLHRLAMQSTSYASMKRQELQATAIVLQSLVDKS